MTVKNDFPLYRHSERNEMESKNLRVDVSTALNMTVKDVSIAR